MHGDTVRREIDVIFAASENRLLSFVVQMGQQYFLGQRQCTACRFADLGHCLRHPGVSLPDHLDVEYHDFSF